MERKVLCLLCILLPVVSVNAQTDTLAAENITNLNEVVITGTRTPKLAKDSPVLTRVITDKDIRKLNPGTFQSLLEMELPGIEFTSNANVPNINLQGLDGNYVLFLIDGERIAGETRNNIDYDLLNPNNIERVEIVKGSLSTLYGSNAMGGVINIITKKQQANGFKGGAKVMYGSYNTLSSELQAGWKKDRFFTHATAGYNRSDGHRKDMEFEQLNGFFKTGYNFTSNWTGFADFSISKTESSNPGTMAAPIIDNDAEVTRGVTSIVLENEYAKSSGAVKFFFNFGSHHINDGYFPGGQPRPNRFRSDDQMLGFTAYQSYKLFRGNNTTAGFDFQRFGGKAWQKFPDAGNNVELADVHLDEYAGYLNTQQTLPGNKITLNAGVRLDHHAINGSEWIPQFGISYTPTAANTIKAIVSKGFRNPTIRELYMFPPMNNPDLLPERLMNYEISFLQSLLENRLSLGLNLFHINGDNMIQVTMVEGKPLHVNSGKVENKGVEITTGYRANDAWRFYANYSYLNMKHKIVGAPEHKLYLSGNYSLNRWNLSSGVQYIGNLYTGLAADPKKDSFVLLNARVNFKALDWLGVFLKGENLLNRKYEINAGFPMPGTTVFSGFQLHL